MPLRGRIPPFSKHPLGQLTPATASGETRGRRRGLARRERAPGPRTSEQGPAEPVVPPIVPAGVYTTR